MTDARHAYQAVNDAIQRTRERQAGIVATALARVSSGLGVDAHHPRLFAELDAELDLLAAVREVAEEAIRQESAPMSAERPHPAEVVIEAATRAAGRVRP